MMKRLKGGIRFFWSSLTRQRVFCYFLNRSQIENKRQLLPPWSLCEILFPNLKIVFTDLAVYYPKVLADLFPGVDHQLCLIHGLRALFGEYNKIRHRYNKVLGNRMIKSRQLHDLKLTIRYRQKSKQTKKGPSKKHR